MERDERDARWAETYEAGILEALDDLGREGAGDLAVIVAVGGGCVQWYLGHVETTLLFPLSIRFVREESAQSTSTDGEFLGVD